MFPSIGSILRATRSTTLLLTLLLLPLAALPRPTRRLRNQRRTMRPGSSRHLSRQSLSQPEDLSRPALKMRTGRAIRCRRRLSPD